MIVIYLTFSVVIFVDVAEFGVHLTQLTVDTEAAVAQRQLSSVLLKQYVESHWSALADDKFRPPEVTDEVCGWTFTGVS